MVALPQSVWAKGSGLCLFLFCLLSWGTWMGVWGPNKRQIMGLFWATNELSLGNGSQKEKEVWVSIVAHLGPEWEGDDSSRMNSWDPSSHIAHATSLFNNNSAETVYRRTKGYIAKAYVVWKGDKHPLTACCARATVGCDQWHNCKSKEWWTVTSGCGHYRSLLAILTGINNTFRKEETSP